MQWYYSKDSTQLGPVPDSQLRAMIAAGEVAGTDMVWREGMKDWRPLSSVVELNAAVAAGVPGAPPPPPAPGSPYQPPMAAGTYVPANPMSGLAIASFVCGVLALVTFTFLPGIPAVICGHMAISRIAAPGARLSGKGFAVAGLITGYLSMLVLVGLFLILLLVGVSMNSRL